MLQVSVGKDGVPGYLINEKPIAKSAIEAPLQAIFAIRLERLMFVKGSAYLMYATIAGVIDFGHQASVVNIGIVTRGVAGGAWRSIPGQVPARVFPAAMLM